MLDELDQLWRAGLRYRHGGLHYARAQIELLSGLFLGPSKVPVGVILPQRQFRSLFQLRGLPLRGLVLQGDGVATGRHLVCNLRPRSGAKAVQVPAKRKFSPIRSRFRASAAPWWSQIAI